VAEVDGEVLGELLLYARPLDGERIPEASVDLAFCAVRAGDRGRGIGTALTSHAVERIRERGCGFVTIDVRTTNRRASTFWGHFPFAPVVARFERHLAEPR
jgi:ribosomal protein S18 acetylase RimI-like enzyme